MYLEIDPSVREDEELQMLREEVHRFAKEVVRPAAKELDQMDSRKAVEKNSPYFDVMRKMKENGYHRLLVPEEDKGMQVKRPEAFNIFFEELGWGSVGFATAIGVDMIPTMLMSMVGSPEIKEEVLYPWMEDERDEYRGCWCVMDPERGSDYIIAMTDPHPERLGTEGFCRAIRDGDGYAINGVKSNWASSAPCANWTVTHPLVPPHNSPIDIGAVMVPLTAPGVTQSPPIDKIGLRDDPQGEIIFDNVKVPAHYMVASSEYVPGQGALIMKAVISCTSCGMGSFYTGLARAAFEETLKYTRERIQGGKPLIEHQLTQYRLAKMFEKVESSRYYVRQATKNVWERVIKNQIFDQSTAHCIYAQIYAKDRAFEVAHDALQLHGATGTTKDVLVEKLFRDARSGLIEDGTSEVLALEAMADVIAEKTYTID